MKTKIKIINIDTIPTSSFIYSTKDVVAAIVPSSCGVVQRQIPCLKIYLHLAIAVKMNKGDWIFLFPVFNGPRTFLYKVISHLHAMFIVMICKSLVNLNRITTAGGGVLTDKVLLFFPGGY